MDWKQKAKELYHKAAHGMMSYVAPVLMVLPNAGAARSNSKVDVDKDEQVLKQTKVETLTVKDRAGGSDVQRSLVYNPEVYQDISCLDMEKVTEKVSQMTLGEILQKGLISQEQLQAYQFSDEDFKQMKPGKLGQKLKSALEKSCTGSPQGKCLAEVREKVGEAWGVNVYTPSGLAKDWPKSVAESDMPVVFIGQVKVKEGKDGKLVDSGNIKLQDLLHLQEAIVVIDGNSKNVNGKQQKAGHVSLVDTVVDEQGNRVATVSLCDGREDYEKVVNEKIGGGERRYGDTAVVMMPNDVKPSIELAKYVVEEMAVCTNAVEFCAKISPQKDILQECLKVPYGPNFSAFSHDYVLTQLERVRKKEQKHNKKLEPIEKTLADASQRTKESGVETKTSVRRQFERS